MIRCVLIINDHGKARLVRFYDDSVRLQFTPRFMIFQKFQKQQVIMQTVFNLISSRDSSIECCFVENIPKELGFAPDEKLIYRHFSSLYFIIIADSSESELGILDLLQVFVHVLDSCFQNICEVDIVYHYDRVNYVLDELVMAGMVLETNSEVIINTIGEVNKYSKAIS